jgi:hypothetical protein
VKTWSDYVAEAEQYRHYKQRCEQLEAALNECQDSFAEVERAAIRAMQRCEQLEAVYQAAETLVNQWASPTPDREAAESAAIALQRAVRQHRAERRALRLSGGDQREPQP